jgi:tRNA-dihydrouridine synthase B
VAQIYKTLFTYGKTILPNQALLLAPMEDVSDRSFRSICRRYGADFVTTEFITSDGLIRGIRQIREKMQIGENDHPVAIQLYGNDKNTLIEAALIAEEQAPDHIDINWGCPVKKIATRGGGSGMLRDIPKLLEITQAIIQNVKLPVTVKTRTGWDEQSIVIDRLAEQLQDIGVQALTIHGRTRDQLYSGTADWEIIGRVKNNPRIKIPIIGNGDIDSGLKAREVFNRYGVDGIMIGRAAIGNPFVFKQIRHYLNTGESLDPLSLSEQIHLLKEMIDAAIEIKSEKSGILHMRRHLALNFKALPDFRSLRIQMLRAGSRQELWSIFDVIESRYADN